MARSKQFVAGDWVAPLFEMPARLPFSAWTGHIPFLFLIFQAARPKTFVELGVFAGASFLAACDATRCFETGTRCFGVDTWQGDEHTGVYQGERMYAELKSIVAGQYPSAELIRSAFDEALGRFADRSIDLLHIDGYHTYEAVSHDFHAWLPKLSDSSIVLFHDIEVRTGDFGVWKLWAELKQRYRALDFTHSHGLGVLLVGSRVPQELDRLLRELEADSERLELFRTVCEVAGASLPSRVQRREALQTKASAARRSDPGDPSTWRHVGRNEQCPCGSGKKYKHCHGRLIEQS